MGLPLSVAFFGPEAAVPAALVFCFDCTVQFVLTAFLATLAHERNEEAHWGAVAWRIVKQVATHPFIVATALGVAASALQFTAPGALGTILEMLMRSAGPTALFALGVTVGMRRFQCVLSSRRSTSPISSAPKPRPSIAAGRRPRSSQYRMRSARA